MKNKNLIAFAGAGAMLFLFMQIVYGMPVPMNYLFMFFSVVMVGTGFSGGYKINIGCAALLVVAALSIMSNDIPSFFKPWQRLGLFTLLMIGCSPLINGKEINKVRRQMTMGALWAVGLITVWSFLGRFTGQGQYLPGIVNGYMGVTGHPNFLGFFVTVTMVWCAALFFRCTKMIERVIVASVWAMGLVVILMAASRTSTACALIGSLVCIYLRLQKSAGNLATSAVVIAGLVVFCWPIIAPYTATMMKKDTSMDADTMVAASRGAIWDLRYAEHDEAPWLGVGAYSCDIYLPNAQVFYSEGTGSIELGSSYLGLLSQCGWFGLLAFLGILITIAWKAYRYATKERTPYAQLMFALCVALGAHMVFEGYAMTAGAVQCVILWMIIGAADQCDTVADYPVMWEKEDPITPEEYVKWRDENNK